MRIVFTTDIHIGADAAGYQMQTRWIEGIDRVLLAFASRMNQMRPDLVIIGGDTVEGGTPELIGRAASFVKDVVVGAADRCLPVAKDDSRIRFTTLLDGRSCNPREFVRRTDAHAEDDH